VNALILLAQAFFDHQTRTQTQNLKDAGLRAAITGRRMAIAGVFFAIAGAFVFSAIIVTAVDIGLQIDRSHAVTFSGLMVSAILLLLVGFFSAFAGWLAGREPKALLPVVTTPVEPPKSELRPLLEAVAVGLLREFLENQNRKHAKDEGSDA
jgi:hypothetical protein